MSSQVVAFAAHCSPASVFLGRSRALRPPRSNQAPSIPRCNSRQSASEASRHKASQKTPWVRLLQSSGLRTSRRLLLAVSGGIVAVSQRRQRGGAARATMTVEVAVKGAVGNPEVLGDCPFSQRVLITLEEKHVPYTMKMIDLSNKPQWYLDANPAGKVPALRTADGWLADSDEITKLLEKEHPEPSLVTPPERASVGSKIFPSFVAFLKSDDPKDGTEDKFIGELEALDKGLSEGEGPFIAGEKITQVDAALIPKLYHAKVALKALKGWEIPAKLEHVHQYIKATTDTESFKKTTASDDLIVKGWLNHEGVKKQV